MFDFSKVGIKEGDVLTYKGDPTVTAQVVGNSHILYQGEVTSLSRAARDLDETVTASGPKRWLYDGKTLAELREEKKGPKPQPNNRNRYEYGALSSPNFTLLGKDISDWADEGYKVVFVQGVVTGNGAGTNFVALMEKNE